MFPPAVFCAVQNGLSIEGLASTITHSICNVQRFEK